jgi:VWFA-related protein
MMRTAFALAAAGIALGLAQESQKEPLFRTHADRVRVDVLVTANDGVVTGLSADDFRLLDNRVPQRLELLDRSGPVWLILVLDVSQSVDGEKLSRLREGCEAAVNHLEAGDQAALLTFAEEVSVAAPLSPRVDALLSALRTVPAGGRTALYDAVFTAVALVSRATTRILIVVFSDGQDTMSVLEPASVRDIVRTGNAVLYGVLTDVPADRQHSRWLNDVSRDTGGRTLVAGAPEKLSRVFLRILAEFRGRYVLTYVPTGVGRDDGWHEIDVLLRNTHGKLTTRRGYMATR